MSTPRIAWRDVPPEEQWQLVRRVRDRVSAELMALPNVKHVGIGIKYAEGERLRYHCVQIKVRSKWEKGTKRPGKIPEHFPAIAETPLGRGRVLVPTDVVVDRVAKIQGAGGASAQGTYPGVGPVNGTNCCLIRMAGDPRPHVLGCNHVIFLTELRSNPAASELPNFLLSFGGNIIGPPELRITVGTIDAAIVPFPTATAGDELVGLPGVRLTDWVRSEAMLPYHCQALTARDEILLEYDGVGPYEMCCFHGNGTSYTYPMVLQYKYPSGKRTIRGDSGSPWVDSNNRLVGMHVAGDATHAFAIPMYTLIERFGGKLSPILAL